MNEEEKYLFDLNGYLIIDKVLTSAEVAQANEAIDRHIHQGSLRSRDASLDGDSPTLRGDKGRGELHGMLEWDEPWCLPFRDMLVHSKIIPHLHEILGKGFRMDHDMCLLWMDKGAEGFWFHGSSGPGFDPNSYYIFRDGKMHNGLTVVAFQLADVNPGDGGLAVIPGSHKSNFECPREMLLYKKHREHVKEVVCKAGDVIIFTEALTHGTVPWTNDHQRRAILTRYTAGNLAYTNGNREIPAWANERQRAVLEPPYHNRLDRPILDE